MCIRDSRHPSPASLRASHGSAALARRWLLADGTNNAVLLLDFTEEAVLAQEREEDEEADDDDSFDGLAFS